jgi:hypothetical protein
MATVDLSIYTGWNLRSRAASFPIVFLYSSAEWAFEFIA